MILGSAASARPGARTLSKSNVELTSYVEQFPRDSRVPTLLRSVWPPRDLYQRLRWIFFAFSLIEMGLVAGTLVFATPSVGSNPLRLVIVVCGAALGAKWYLDYTNRSPLPPAAVDLFDAAALCGAGLLIQLPLEIYMLLLTRVSSRSFDRRGVMSLSTVYYGASYGISVAVAHAFAGTPVLQPGELLLVGVFPLSSFTVQYMGASLRDLREANTYAEVLLAAAKGLEPHMTLGNIGQVATAAGLALLGGRPDSSVHFASGDEAQMTVKASTGELSLVGMAITLESLVPARLPGLRAGNRTLSTMGELGLATSAAHQETVAEIFPLAEDGHLRGALVVASHEASDGRSLSSLLSLSEHLEAVVEQQALALTIQRQNDSTFRQMFLTNPNPMWIFDFETLAFLEVNQAAVGHYGYSHEEFLSLTLPDLSPPEDVPALKHDLKQRSSGNFQSHSTRRHVRKDGSIILVEITGQPHQFGDRPAAMALLLDVTEKVALQEQLQAQAFHDPLTGLANRALFADRLDHALAGRRRGTPPTAAVVMIDLDNFKTINDTRGHATGDNVLEQVARRLESTSRPGDTVARLGGDEFVILLPDAASPENATAAAERTLAALHVPLDFDGDDWFISASVGVALDPEGGLGSEELMAQADVAMYTSKHRGGAQVCLYRQEMFMQSGSYAANSRELSEAIGGAQLRVQYQPQVDIASGRMVGVEALVRWLHPTRGLIPPADFIPMAEETGLIGSIDLWVATEAIRQLVAWDKQGLPMLRLSLNVSAGELLQASFVDRLWTIIKGCELDPSRVEVEVTETAAVESAGATAALTRLKQIGVTIAIDDFGIGHSTLARLEGLPVDKLKIDRSFVHQLSTSRGAALVAGMISMGHSLNLTMIAEGVERQDELNQLAGLGCDQVQGFIISRPVEPEDLSQLLKSSRTLSGRSATTRVRLAVV